MIQKPSLIYFMASLILNFNGYTSETKKELEEEKLPVYRTIQNVPIQNITGYKLSFDKKAHYGYLLQVNDKGNIDVLTLDKNNAESHKKLYKDLNEQITTGFEVGELNISCKSDICNYGATFRGKNGIKATTPENFSSEYTLHGSDGPIILAAKRFNIKTSFVDVCVDKTIIEFRPHSFIENKPISCIRFTPKSTPVFMQVDIDFANKTMSSACVTESDLEIEFNQK